MPGEALYCLVVANSEVKQGIKTINIIKLCLVLKNIQGRIYKRAGIFEVGEDIAVWLHNAEVAEIEVI